MTSVKHQKAIDAIILEGDARVLVDTAQAIASEMIKFVDGKLSENRSVSTSQIRNIYGASKKIEMTLHENNVAPMYNRLILLKPKMAYANGRFNNKKGYRPGEFIPGLKTLVDSLSYAIDIADANYMRMKIFFNFFEAILAYHKAEGGN